MFSGTKKHFFLNYCSVLAKKLHINMSSINFFLNFFLAQNRLNIHNQLCTVLLETPPIYPKTYDLGNFTFKGGQWFKN